MVAILLFQGGALDATTGTALTTVLGLTTTILGMLVVAQNARVKDKEGEVVRLVKASDDALKAERDGRAKAEAREDEAVSHQNKSAAITVELATALREATMIIKDAATESRAAHMEALRNRELLERQDRRGESIERGVNQLVYRWPAGAPPPVQPGS